MKNKFLIIFALCSIGVSIPALAAQSQLDTFLPALTLTTDSDGNQKYSVTLQILLMMTALSFLPAVITTMTSFSRIVIVMSILRQAMGLQQTPSNRTVIGIAMFLTMFIMAPVIDRINNEAVQPYLNDQIDIVKAFNKAKEPIRDFMLSQTRTTDIQTFVNISGIEVNDVEDLPMNIIIPSFITSEMKTAFQIGFMLFIPFLIIDIVTASILMAMGMMMLSPMIVSLPFKIMLFVLVDGWSLVLGSLAKSFGVGA